MKHEITANNLTWVNVQCPESDELAEFIREGELRRDDAEYVAERYHRPGITVRADYVLMMVQVPVFDRKLRLTQGVALFFIIRENSLHTLHYEPIITVDKIIRDLAEAGAWQEEIFDEGALSLALSLVSLLYESSFRKLERLNKHIDIAEDAVFQGNERKMMEEVSLLTRDVMDFRKVIRVQTNLFKKLPASPLVTSEAAIQWERVGGQAMKMWDVLESMFESVKELGNTNFTLLQHKENELLRLLTIYSIIVIPMLVLTDPFFDPRAGDSKIIDDIAFWIILSILVMTLLVILVKAKRKKLL